MATLADALRQTGYSQDGTLAAPTTESPMTKALSEHIKTLPQQLATNQAALDNAIGSWNKTDFGTGQPNPNYRPEAIQELTQLMPNVMGATAWHGTPHTINGKFDINKVGTGEGAQAYGHGMYFAENPNVATEYRKALSGRTDLGQQPSDPAFIHAVESFREYGTPLEQIPAEMKKAYKSATDKDIKLAIQATEKGNLYKVDIPDADIPNMLDWDKPLSQQTEAVRDALKKHENTNTQKVLDGRLKTRETLVKEGKDTTNIDNQIDILREEIADPTLPETTGEKYYSMYANRFNNMKDTSDYLHSLGIKGIRYLDQGSRGTRKGSSNFVVFDPSTVKILEENGKPLTRKELIEQQLNKVVE